VCVRQGVASPGAIESVEKSSRSGEGGIDWEEDEKKDEIGGGDVGGEVMMMVEVEMPALIGRRTSSSSDLVVSRSINLNIFTSATSQPWPPNMPSGRGSRSSASTFARPLNTALPLGASIAFSS
jgi:hypothetical protein